MYSLFDLTQSKQQIFQNQCYSRFGKGNTTMEVGKSSSLIVFDHTRMLEICHLAMPEQHQKTGESWSISR